MFWVYVLKCENDLYYVGMTQHLYKRLAKHRSGDACANTRENKPVEIVGLYKGEVNVKFNTYLAGYYSTTGPDQERLFEVLDNFDYDSGILKADVEGVENYVTEHMQLVMPDQNIRGGRYLKGEKADVPDKTIHSARPTCLCGLPCEVQKRVQNKKVKFIYVCPLRNVWDDMRKNFKPIPIGIACRYHMEFTDDIEFRIGHTAFSN